MKKWKPRAGDELWKPVTHKSWIKNTKNKLFINYVTAQELATELSKQL